MRGRSGLATMCLAAACLGACGGPREPGTPREVLREYGRALEDGRLDAAYRLLSADARRRLPFTAFARMVRENPEEARRLGRSLAGPTEPTVLTATVVASDGTTLPLVWEDGGWRVEAAAIDLYSQSTPEAAVASFVRAYRRKRWDLLLRFVPDEERHGLTAGALQAAWQGEQKEEIEGLMRALQEALVEPDVELLGDRATLRYGTTGTLDLVLEGGLWKVEDFR